MLAEVEVSTPGKVILMGEHAAVYGRPAIVAAFGLRTRARARRRGDRAVLLELESVRHREETRWPDLVRYARERRAAWERYAESPGGTSAVALRGADAGHLVKVALGELALALGASAPPGLDLRVTSALPVGAGFGSSASVAVAVLAAASLLSGEELDPESLDRLALEVERRQHGAPSGIDHRTVVSGGIQQHRRAPEGLESRRLEPANELLDGLAVFDSGAPRQTTGEVVAEVARLARSRGAWFEARLEAMAEATGRFGRALEAAAGSPEELGAAMRACERELESLGVVPAAVCRRVRAIEAAGGAAKVSGAGSTSGPGAGSLLVLGAGAAAEALAGLERLAAPLGVEGLRVEAAA